jgi:hypothetical protein
MNILKQYLKHFIDKMFFLSISFKTHTFITITGVTSWLTYERAISGDNYAFVMSALITTTLAAREYSKTQFNKGE